METKFFLVANSVLPEIFGKVVNAKALLAQGEAKNASQASQMAGISRSAFYKYKDYVFSFDRHMHDNIMTFNLILVDKPGILGAVLSSLYELGVNILTINQSLSSDGVAPVSISVDAGEMKVSSSDLSERLMELGGVVSCKQVTGR